MKTLGSYDLPHQFLNNILQNTVHQSPNMNYLIERLITGILGQEKPSARKIHQELVVGESLKTFYRQIHHLAAQMPFLFSNIIQSLQNGSDIPMKVDGVLSIDEHLIPHTSPKMEGVDYFHSSSSNGKILAHSIISTHYFRRGIEYPVSFQFYRRERELEKWGETESYRKKNDIAREELENICRMANSPKYVLMDSYFMTKENCRLLQNYKKTYISRPKRNWKGTLDHKRQSLTEIFEGIPDGEFQQTCVRNPKMRSKKYYLTASRNIFFPKIGNHQVIFVKILSDTVRSPDLFQNVEETVDSRGYAFRVFITNDLEMSVERALSLYSLRWTIETGYRDMSQNLGLHGCIWQNLSGQYCFIGLSFLCYIFLMWARHRGAFSHYGLDLRTIGQLRMAFRHYLQGEFAEWLEKIHLQCQDCKMANWLYQHVFVGS